MIKKKSFLDVLRMGLWSCIILLAITFKAHECQAEAMDQRKTLGVKIAADLNRVAMKPFVALDSSKGSKPVTSRLDIYPTTVKRMPLILSVYAKERITREDEIVLEFRQLFTGVIKTIRLATLTNIPSNQIAIWPLDIAKNEIPFAEGAYYLSVDIQRDGESLSGGDVGSLFYYLADDGMSLGYVVGCYQLAFADILVDPRRNGCSVFIIPKPARLPMTVDPYKTQTRDRWDELFRKKLLNFDDGKDVYDRGSKSCDSLPAELVADGGFGILFSMFAFREIGDESKAQFAFNVFDRLVCDRVRYNKYAPYINQAWHLIRVLSYACLVLHEDPLYSAWCHDILDNLIPSIAIKTDSHFSHLAITDKSGKPYKRYTDGVYVGRILGGQAFYQYARMLINKQSDDSDYVADVDRIISYAVEEAAWIMKNGVYMAEKKGSDSTYNMCGDINFSAGLIGAYNLAVLKGREDDSKVIAKALAKLLKSSNEATEPFPPYWMGWMDGDAYTICEMAIRITGEQKVKEFQRRFIPNSDIDIVAKGAREAPYGMQHRLNTTAAMILSSPEYIKTVKNKDKFWESLIASP